jgi:hypothetical protein
LEKLQCGFEVDDYFTQFFYGFKSEDYPFNCQLYVVKEAYDLPDFCNFVGADCRTIFVLRF